MATRPVAETAVTAARGAEAASGVMAAWPSSVLAAASTPAAREEAEEDQKGMVEMMTEAAEVLSSPVEGAAAATCAVAPEEIMARMGNAPAAVAAPVKNIFAWVESRPAVGMVVTVLTEAAGAEDRRMPVRAASVGVAAPRAFSVEVVVDSAVEVVPAATTTEVHSAVIATMVTVAAVPDWAAPFLTTVAT